MKKIITLIALMLSLFATAQEVGDTMYVCRNDNVIERIAVSKIREMVEFYKSKFKDRDVQDALSMSVLHFAVKMVKLEQNREFDNLVDDLKVLDRQLDEYLASIR